MRRSAIPRSGRVIRPLILSVAAAAVLASAGSLGGQEARPCHDERLEGAAWCGVVLVPEDHADPDSRTLELYVVVVPARADDAPAPDPVFSLSGGPGQAASGIAPFALRGGTPERNRRDLVLVDQRGTGRSNGFDCPLASSLEDHLGRILGSDDVIRRCLAEVSERADPRLYTTTQSAHDLEVVRRALGYGPVNLSGGSYGTRLALEYARRYPEAVRTITIQGVAPVDFRAPLEYAGLAQEALERLFIDCGADPECANAYPDLEGAWESVLAHLRGGPVAVSIPTDQGPLGLEYGLRDFAYTVRSMMYGQLGLSLPFLIDRAARTHDFSQFAEIYIRRAEGLWPQLALGLHLSVFCAEDVPFIREEAVERYTAGTYLGTYVIDEYRRGCEIWPRGDIPDDFHDPVESEAATLILSGRRDPSTPPATGNRVMPYLPNAVHLVHPWGGHGFQGTEDGECEQNAREALLRTGSTDSIDVSCAALERPMPFRLPDPG